jgi:CMP-N-acetylneuraminic acid synthetase
MDRRSAKYLAAIIAVLALLTPASAFADQKSSSQPTAPALDNNAFKAAMDKFREDQKIYQDLVKVYEERRRAINKTFKDAVDKALADVKALGAPGQTQLQKRQNMANKQAAVLNATSIRDAAIEALGLPPVPPTPPAKAPKMEKSKKTGPQSAPSPTSN